MRLYNQNSKNPIASVGLDAKQLRPVRFLSPSYGTQSIKLKQNSIHHNKSAATTDGSSFHSATTASESNVVKCDVVKKTVAPGEFLFDISDGDVWSTGSSSTLSTQASLRNNFGSLPSWTPNNKTSISHNTSVESASMNQKVDFPPGISRSHQPNTSEPTRVAGKQAGSSDLIPIPELSYSGSSSDDIPVEDTKSWFDFSNPSPTSKHRERVTLGSTSHTHSSIGACLYPIQERIDKKVENNSGGLNPKYTTMLLEGIKVDRVKDEMEKDGVDMSIMELMMAAAQTNNVF